VKYLKDAFEFLQKHFEGQTIANATIHMDESKPHLHATFLYFNEKEGKWNQKDLMKKGKTDLNKLLDKFQKEIGEKYGLVRGDSKNLNKTIVKEFAKAQVKVPVKMGILKTEERKFLSIKKAKQAIERLDKKYKMSILENDKLKNELIKVKKENKQLKQENQELKEKINKIKRKNLMLSKGLSKVREIERENNKLKDITNDLIEQLAETKAKLSKSNKTIAKKLIKEQISQKIPSI
jgi:cell division protein FtsB